MVAEQDASYQARESARLKYMPERIKWLLIAEAPPDALDRFFYYEDVNEKDYLYVETMKVLFSSTPESDFRRMKGQYLQWFKKNGFYLIDVMDAPIPSGTRSRGRREMIWANRRNVLQKLDRLKNSLTDETRIVLIKATVYELNAFLRHAGYAVANRNMIPFPSTGHQLEYREEITKLFGPYGTEPLHDSEFDDEEAVEEADRSEEKTFGSMLPARLLLDEYSSSFAGHLTEEGWDVKTVYDFGLEDGEPEEIVSFAIENDAVIVSRNETLYEAAFSAGARCIPINVALTVGIAKCLFMEKYPESKGEF